MPMDYMEPENPYSNPYTNPKKETLIVALKGILIVALTGTLNPKRPST